MFGEGGRTARGSCTLQAHIWKDRAGPGVGRSLYSKVPCHGRSLYSEIQCFGGVELGSRPGLGDPCTVMFHVPVVGGGARAGGSLRGEVKYIMRNVHIGPHPYVDSHECKH